MWRKWRSLPFAEKWLTIQALCALPLVWLSLRLFGFGRTTQRLQHTVAPSPTDTISPAQCVAVVQRAARLLPGQFTCLPRSLTLAWLLQRHGHAAIVRLGVRRENALLQAHAWVEIDGVPVGDSAEFIAQFQPFTTWNNVQRWV
jgi:hypothetical protein